MTGVLGEWPWLQKRREVFVAVLIAYCFLGPPPSTNYARSYVSSACINREPRQPLLFFLEYFQEGLHTQEKEQKYVQLKNYDNYIYLARGQLRCDVLEAHCAPTSTLWYLISGGHSCQLVLRFPVRPGQGGSFLRKSRTRPQPLLLCTGWRGICFKGGLKRFTH